MISAQKSSSATPGAEPLVQRSCGCGGSCDSCARKRVQRSAFARGGRDVAPSSVYDVLRSPGAPLDGRVRGDMERVFGHDFSGVRVHADSVAAQSAESIDARAYTVGDHIAFRAGAYAPHSAAGRRLLAHELAHAVQQKGTAAEPAPSLEVGAASSPAEREADSAADAVMAARRPSALSAGPARVSRVLESEMHFPSQQPQANPFQPLSPQQQPAQGPTTYRQIRGLGGPPGTNPSTCIAPVCASLRSVNPGSESGVLAQGRRFRREATDCLTRTGPSSGARHRDAIVQNDVAEIGHETDVIDAEIRTAESPRSRAIAVSTYMENLRNLCARKQREIDVEFRYNVILENTDIRQWGSSDPHEMDNLEAALAAAPREVTWDNQVEVHLRRDRCLLTNAKDPLSCLSGVGGQTDYSRGRTTATVDVYDEGLSASPYPRTAARRIPGATQTVTHELGHVTEEQVPEAVRNDLRDRILDWHEWPDVWIGGAHPIRNDERRNAMALAGIADSPAFDAFLGGLQDDRPVAQNNRTWVVEVDHTNNSRRYLTWRLGAVPNVLEYQYARTGWGDFFAETYMFALNRAEWLISTLPADQIAWWRENVFHIPVSRQAWQLELAGISPLPTPDEIDSILRTVMTRDQANRAIEAMRSRRRRDLP